MTTSSTICEWFMFTEYAQCLSSKVFQDELYIHKIQLKNLAWIKLWSFDSVTVIKFTQLNHQQTVAFPITFVWSSLKSVDCKWCWLINCIKHFEMCQDGYRWGHDRLVTYVWTLFLNWMVMVLDLMQRIWVVIRSSEKFHYLHGKVLITWFDSTS